jgi:hypothetical protein
MRLTKKRNQNPRNQDNLDQVVLKHIPLGTPADVAMKICQKNGFKAMRSGDMKGANYPGFEEHIFCSLNKSHWYLIATDEYRVILYLKNNQVGAVVGRYFLHTL